MHPDTKLWLKCFAICTFCFVSGLLIADLKAAPPEMQRSYDEALNRITPNTQFRTRVTYGRAAPRTYRGCEVLSSKYDLLDIKCEALVP